MGLEKLNAVSFEEAIYDDGANCLVAFSRKNCHVCQEVIPLIEELSTKYQDQYGFYLVDVEDEKDLYNRFPLKGVPSVLFFKDGSYKGKIAGKFDEEQIEEMIEKMI